MMIRGCWSKHFEDLKDFTKYSNDINAKLLKSKIQERNEKFL